MTRRLASALLCLALAGCAASKPVTDLRANEGVAEILVTAPLDAGRQQPPLVSIKVNGRLAVAQEMTSKNEACQLTMHQAVRCSYLAAVWPGTTVVTADLYDGYGSRASTRTVSIQVPANTKTHFDFDFAKRPNV